MRHGSSSSLVVVVALLTTTASGCASAPDLAAGTGELSGIVVGRPDVGAEPVRLLFDGPVAREVSAETGELFEVVLPAGSYRVAVEGEGQVCPRTVVVTSGARQRTDLVWPYAGPCPRNEPPPPPFEPPAAPPVVEPPPPPPADPPPPLPSAAGD